VVSRKKPRKTLSKSGRTLAEYRKAHGCFLCYIPQREEIEKARADGADIKDIVGWLVEDCGYSREEVQKARHVMPYHFTNHAGVVKKG
jgi:hypothetical protein